MLGRPDLAAKYNVFAVPAGLLVRELKETEKGLQVIFYDPWQRHDEILNKEMRRKSEIFFAEIGFTQYSGKYAPFDIPQGAHVENITESEQGLQISFHDPVAEVEQAKSIEFFTGLGYAQYGGKYKPFEVPQGLHVGDIQESDTGLKVTFHDPIAEVEQQKSIEFFTGIGYSQFGGRYAPFEVPTGTHVENITESEQGLQISFHDPIVEAQLNESAAFFSGLGYSQFAGKYAPFEIPTGLHVGDIQESDKGLQVTFHDPIAEAEQQKSIEFFTGLGFAQFGGKYKAFEVPEGKGIAGITETEQGLSVEWALSLEEQEAMAMAPLLSMRNAFLQSGIREYNQAVYDAYKLPDSPEKIIAQQRVFDLAYQQEIIKPQDYQAATAFTSKQIENQFQAFSNAALAVSPLGGPLPSAYWETPSGEKAPAGYTTLTVDERSKLSGLNVIAIENQNFIKALESGKISGAEYNTAILAQYERAIALEPSIPKGMIVSGIEYKVGKVNLGLSPLIISGIHGGLGLSPLIYDEKGLIIGYGMHNEPIYQIPAPKGAPRGLDYSERYALMGMASVTAFAIPFGAGTLARAAVIVGGGGAITGGAEAIKYGSTGQHLTAEEAINAFAIGEVVGVGLLTLNSKFIEPRVTEYVSRSYEKTLDTGELWHPTIKEQVLMKITGAKPTSLTLQSKAIDILTTSYDKQVRLNQELIETDGFRNVPFGTEPSLELKAAIGQMDWQGSSWIASIKEREIMALVGVRPRPLPTSFVSAGFIDEEFMSFKGLQARAYAEASFDFSMSPRSSLIMVNKTPVEMANIVARNRLPLYFGLGSPYQIGYGEKTVLTEFKDVPYLEGRDLPLERGIPENILAYDYRGPLSFKKEMFEPIIKTISKSGGMKPLWDSIGSKASEEVIFSSRSLTQFAILQERTIVSGALPSFAGATQATVKATNPFLLFSGKSYFAQRNQLEEEFEYIYTNYPGSGLAQPVSPAKLVTRLQELSVGVMGISGKGQESYVFPYPILNIGETLHVPVKVTPERRFDTVVTQRVRQGQRTIQDVFPLGYQIPILDRTPFYDTTPRSDQTTILKPDILIALATTLRQEQITIPKLDIPITPQFDIPPTQKPKPPASLPPVLFPYNPLGGGGGGSRGSDLLFGRWKRQKNPVKPFGAMLKTFGVGAGKGKVAPVKMRIGVPKQILKNFEIGKTKVAIPKIRVSAPKQNLRNFKDFKIKQPQPKRKPQAPSFNIKSNVFFRKPIQKKRRRR